MLSVGTETRSGFKFLCFISFMQCNSPPDPPRCSASSLEHPRVLRPRPPYLRDTYSPLDRIIPSRHGNTTEVDGASNRPQYPRRFSRSGSCMRPLKNFQMPGLSWCGNKRCRSPQLSTSPRSAAGYVRLMHD